MEPMVGARVLITKKPHSGRHGHVAYIFYRRNGLCQMEPNRGDGWKKVYWVVPEFDHCGEPRIVVLSNGDFAFVGGGDE